MGKTRQTQRQQQQQQQQQQEQSIVYQQVNSKKLSTSGQPTGGWGTAANGPPSARAPLEQSEGLCPARTCSVGVSSPRKSTVSVAGTPSGPRIVLNNYYTTVHYTTSLQWQNMLYYKGMPYLHRNTVVEVPVAGRAKTVANQKAASKQKPPTAAFYSKFMVANEFTTGQSEGSKKPRRWRALMPKCCTGSIGAPSSVTLGKSDGHCTGLTMKLKAPGEADVPGAHEGQSVKSQPLITRAAPQQKRSTATVSSSNAARESITRSPQSSNKPRRWRVPRLTFCAGPIGAPSMNLNRSRRRNSCAEPLMELVSSEIDTTPGVERTRTFFVPESMLATLQLQQSSANSARNIEIFHLDGPMDPTKLRGRHLDVKTNSDEIVITASQQNGEQIKMCARRSKCYCEVGAEANTHKSSDAADTTEYVTGHLNCHNQSSEANCHVAGGSGHVAFPDGPCYFVDVYS